MALRARPTHLRGHVHGDLEVNPANPGHGWGNLDRGRFEVEVAEDELRPESIEDLHLRQEPVDEVRQRNQGRAKYERLD